MIGTSLCAIRESILIGKISAVMARTSPMFAILDPSALPTANDGVPAAAAEAETSISGADVPNETTVKPIMSGLRPILRAIAAAPSTKNQHSRLDHQ